MPTRQNIHVLPRGFRKVITALLDFLDEKAGKDALVVGIDERIVSHAPDLNMIQTDQVATLVSYNVAGGIPVAEWTPTSLATKDFTRYELVLHGHPISDPIVIKVRL
jgi:hypothetical protein